jgi:hypothetical protein
MWVAAVAHACVPARLKQEEKGDKVNSLFDNARKSGAVEGTSADLKQGSTFKGTGRTLAGGAEVRETEAQNQKRQL